MIRTPGLPINNATLAALIGEAAPEIARGTIFGVGSSRDSASGVIMPPISLSAYGSPSTAAISGVLTLVALFTGLAQTRRRGKRTVE